MSYQMPLEPRRPRLETDNPFEQIARVWEDESRALRQDPDKPSPRDIGTRRMRELRQMWEKHAKIEDVDLGRHQRRANKSQIQTGEK